MTYIVRRYETTYNSGVKNDITVANNTVNTSNTAFSLVGEGILDYPALVGDNILWGLENFAGELPPAGALPGQLWYHSVLKDIFVYDGAAVDEGGDSTILANWNSLETGLNDVLADHVASTGAANPHNTDKDDVGLGLVTNQAPLTKSQNLGELLATNSVARANLNIYSASEVYTQAEADALFYLQGDDVADTDRLGGLLPAEYVLVSAPVISSGIDADAVTGRLFSMAADNFLAANNGVEGMSFSSGVDETGLLVTTNNSGVRQILKTEQTTPSFEVNLYDQGLTGNFPPINTTLVLDNTNLYYNGGEVFHEGHLPTPAECSSYGELDTVNDANMLDGFLSSDISTPNTVVQRFGQHVRANNVKCNYGTDVLSPANTAARIIIRDTAQDTQLRAITKSTFVDAITDAAETGVRAWGAYNSVTQSVVSLHPDLAITYIGVGRIRVSFINAATRPSDASYTVITGALDSTTVNTVWSDAPGALAVYSAWNPHDFKFTTFFDINVKAVVNDSSASRTRWAETFSSVFADHSYITFSVFY